VIKIVEGLRSGEFVPKSQTSKGETAMPPIPRPTEA
jgi:hypothetical protein